MLVWLTAQSTPLTDERVRSVVGLNRMGADETCALATPRYPSVRHFEYRVRHGSPDANAVERQQAYGVV